MRKVFYGAVFFGTLLACSSCENTFKDVYGDVNEESKPEWLGGSIYSELQNPDGEKLTGSFSNYLRLIDDLGYAETLNRTGSKTIFPANDEAFARFFAQNDWGVSSYEELTFAQKKLLLYSSMLDNALLVNMLANASAGRDITEGVALKHPTNISVIDSIEYIDPAKMPKNNKYWDQWRNGTQGVYAVRDNTTPMMVHFTREQMVNNGITTTGEGSDFEILTGEKYNVEENNVYIFDNKVIKADVTCLNGYIHQVQNVMMQPGNLAQVIAKQGNTKYFNHILDYYAMPYLDAVVTRNYNDWVQQNQEEAAKYGYAQHDSVMQVRYLSSRSQNAPLVTDPNGASKATTEVLRFDPGWNQYYPSSAYNLGGDQTQISDMAAIFVPTDEAFEKYFLKGGAGEYIIEVYGKKPNTKENLMENLDTLFAARPQILTAFVRNLQQASFVSTVPSKFESIINDASENLGMNKTKLQVKEDGKYDIKIANNGVVYKLNQMIAPDEYSAVLAPSSTYKDMLTMNWAVQDWHSSSTTSYLSLDFKYFLLAMKANYAFFIPDDQAFDCYYLDPTTLGHAQPEMLHIYYDTEKKGEPKIQAESFSYDVKTQTVGERLSTVEIGNVSAPNPRIKSALTDILNYHTVVLTHGDTIGITNKNHYYKTKHGAELYIDYGSNPRQKMEIKSGAALDNGLPAANMYGADAGKASYFSQANGTAYRIDHIIQPTIRSVSEVLRTTPRFSAFHEACGGFANAELMSWIGFSDQEDEFHRTEQDQYLIFSQQDGDYNSLDAVDGNVRMFNTYNYTLYAPNNEAMEKAYAAGLPSWEDILSVFEKHAEQFPDSCPEPYATVLKAKVTALKNFCRYHFQNISLYADNTVEGGTYQSLYTNNYGLAQEYKVSGGSGVITVRDAAGVDHHIDANDASKMTNVMTRDYWLNTDRKTATSIATSSFCAVHEVTEPFYSAKSKRYDAAWAENDITQDSDWSAAKRRVAAKRTRH
ncbi:MAG: hypothetical protein IJ901_06225 [Bacteroidaceae bacterium]|nr:hypothetical protein [Bacteroidaceae bacterium]